MYSSEKLIIAGQTIHHYKYSKPIEYNNDNPHKITKTTNPAPADQINTNIYRTKKAIKIILQCNAFEWQTQNGNPFRPVFITYTFKDNITNLQEANSHFTKYTKRLNYQIFKDKSAKLQYLIVPEFQKRGAVHYHAIYFNLPFIQQIYDFITQIWGHGYTNVKTIKDINHLTNYVSKYITKSNTDERYKAQKKYFTSRSLIKPFQTRDEQIIKILLSENQIPEYTKNYTNENITTTYSSFKITPNQIIAKEMFYQS